MPKLQKVEDRWYIIDDDARIVSDAFTTEFEADAVLRKMGQSSVQTRILADIREERARQDASPGTSMRDQPDGTFLAAACKKLGDAASTLTQLHRNKRNLRQELVETAATLIAWVEELERRERR